MEISHILIPVSILLLLIVLSVLVWAVISGQYDDLDKEGSSILFEDLPKKSPPKKPSDDV